MFNLLPDNFKKQLKTEYRFRLLTVAMSFILFIQLSFFIFLLPSWLISYYREKDANLEAEKMNQLLLNSNLNSIASSTIGLNIKLKTLNTVLDYPKVVPLVLTIISQKNSNIHINELSYSTPGGKNAHITLGGISNTRESLVNFQKNLENTGDFSKVDLPISNLAKEKNINFSINLTLQ
ncbi:hypothetical protein H0W91_03890 [Patescibacteria group bacterium]|nr:hypothetical protein [Patescibacteria group bacterium]